MSGFDSPNILVDRAHGHVYLTGGNGTSDLVVTDLDGENMHVLTGIAPGAAGMALNPDGSKLYIAASGADWLRVVDTTTLALDGQFAGKPDGTPSCPRSLAFAAGQLWVSWGCGGGSDAGIGRVDLQTGAFTLNAIGSFDWRFSGLAPLLATVPSQPNMVIAAETDSAPAHVVRFEATSTVLNQQALRDNDGGAVAQLAITPDGSQVIVPSGTPYYHPAWNTSDLTEVHQYPTAAYPNAVAIRDDGLVIAGVNAEYDKDVYVFEPGGSTPIATYDFGRLPNQDTGDYELVTGGLAVSGNRIYAVVKSSDPSDTSRTLRILTLP